MEKKVYLKNGQVADLIKKIDDNNFLVAPWVTYYGYEGEEYEEPGERIVVEKIFKSPPTDIIQKEYQAVKNNIVSYKQELSGIRAEVLGAQKELRKLQEQKTDIEKMIYNRSELKSAKRITVFLEDYIMPRDMDESAHKSLKISTTFSTYDGEETSWVYGISGDGWNYGDRIDPAYGLILDATDEEIERLTKERAEKKPTDFFRPYHLSRVDEKYLPFPLLHVKMQYLKNERDERIEKLERVMKSHRKELKELKSK